MVMDPFESFVQYWENLQTPTPTIMGVRTGPEQKKLSLLRKFSESLKSTKSMYELPEERYPEDVPLRHVKYWMRNDDAALFRMNNKNIQVNFNDRRKLIIFWNEKKMLMVQSIRETGKVIHFSEINLQGPLSEERRRFAVAKAMLAEMSGR
jgi:polo-like kinase 1